MRVFKNKEKMTSNGRTAKKRMQMQKWTSKVRTQSQTGVQEERPSEDLKILCWTRKH